MDVEGGVNGYFLTCAGDLRVKPLCKLFWTSDKHWSPPIALKGHNPVA
jgi:hypothetical protein